MIATPASGIAHTKTLSAQDAWPIAVFTHRRIKQITACLHYCDESIAKPRDHIDYDRLYKIRSLLDTLKASFQQYYNPACELSADECIIPFQGQWVGRQYDRSKPIQWGVKVWMVTDAKTAYNYNFDVYCGNDPDFEHLENFGVATGVIIKLTQKLHGKGHIVFTNRYYTSPQLLEYLRKVYMAGCGTVQKKRKHFPKQII